MLPLFACLIALFALGCAERAARDRAWREIPIRIHVNGTRGKSTTTRLIWSALRAAGIPAAAKTTGTAARILLPDGREEPVRRLAPASIREQLVFLRRARRAGARAVVVECMALDPSLQTVCERDMLRATIGVITNVRHDHEEVMGDELADIAHSLSNTIPTGGTLVTGAVDVLPVLQERAAALSTRVVAAVPPLEGDPAAENEAVALAVTRELGILDETARRGFAAAPRDPGAVSHGEWEVAGGRVSWIDATAANDPESLQRLLPRRMPASLLVVYNHRADRVPRLDVFGRRCDAFVRADRLLVTGDRPPWTVWGRLSRLARRPPVEYVDATDTPVSLRSAAAGALVVFCGNTRGLDVRGVVREAARRD